MVYDVAPFGFWQTSVEVTGDNIRYVELKRSLGVGIDVMLASGPVYTFRRKNIWQGTYSLQNEAGEEIAMIQATYSWRKFTFDYNIETFLPAVDSQTDQLLPVLLVYCLRYFTVQHSGVF